MRRSSWCALKTFPCQIKFVNFSLFFIASHTTTFITKCMTWRLISKHDVGPSCCFSYLSQNKHEQCHPHWSLSCPSWLACYHCAHIPLLSLLIGRKIEFFLVCFTFQPFLKCGNVTFYVSDDDNKQISIRGKCIKWR